MSEVSISQPKYLRVIAKIASYIFHPLFIPTYIFLWLAFRFPYEFAGMDEHGFKFRLINVFWMTAFFPAFAVFIMWRLKLVDNIFLRTQRERIAPYLITMIFYWWMWYLSRNFTDQPVVLKFFYLGIFLAISAGLTINNFLKISMHAMGVAGGLTCMLLSSFVYGSFLGSDIIVAIFVTGLVCTGRLLLNDHNNREVYLGLFVGMICQFIAYYFVM